MTINERVARCHLIAQVLMADGVMTPEEREFLNEAMERLGLSDAERRQALRDVSRADAEAAVRKLPEAELREVFDELFGAARADGVLNKYETQLVRKIARSIRSED